MSKDKEFSPDFGSGADNKKDRQKSLDSSLQEYIDSLEEELKEHIFKNKVLTKDDFNKICQKVLTPLFLEFKDVPDDVKSAIKNIMQNARAHHVIIDSKTNPLGGAKTPVGGGAPSSGGAIMGDRGTTHVGLAPKINSFMYGGKTIEFKELKEIFDETAHELYRTLEYIESTEPSDSNFLTKEFQKCSDLASELKKIGKELEKKDSIFLKEAALIANDFTRRKLLYFQWNYFKGFTMERRTLDDLRTTEDDIPLSPQLVHDFLHEVVPGRSGEILEQGVQPVFPEEIRDQLAKTDLKPTFDKTLCGEVFRFMDAIEIGSLVIKAKDGSKLNPTNIHNFLPEVTTYIFKTLKDSYPGRNIKESDIRNAIRLHWVITMHQSFLLAPGKTPQVSDMIYQSYKWITYNNKYKGRGFDSWLTGLSDKLFGEGKDFYEGKELIARKQKLKEGSPVLDTLVKRDVDENMNKGNLLGFVLRSVLVGDRINYLKRSEKRMKRKGYGSYGFLLKELINVPSLLWGQKSSNNLNSESYSFAPPLCSFGVKDKESGQLFFNSNGINRFFSFFDLRTSSNKKGSIKSSNILKSEYFLTQSGDPKKDPKPKEGVHSYQEEIGNQLAYEMMPFDMLESGRIKDYWQDYRDGAYALFKNFIKIKEDDLLGKASGESFWQGLSNVLYYAIPYTQGALGRSMEKLLIFDENGKIKVEEILDDEGNDTGNRSVEISDADFDTMQRKKMILVWFTSIVEEIIKNRDEGAEKQITQIAKALLKSEVLKVEKNGVVVETGFEDIVAGLLSCGSRMSLVLNDFAEATKKDILGG